MPEKKPWLTTFLRGFTIFHAVGLICILIGFIVGDVPETILKRSEKLIAQVREIEKDCTFHDRTTKNKVCIMPVADLKPIVGALRSLADDAKKIIGSNGELNVLGSKIPYRITGAQILGVLIFFFGSINSILKSRFGGKKGE